MSDSLLIGRQHPASTLRAAIQRTSSSHGGLVLVTGEAGIGKTTLVTSLAAEASQHHELSVLVGSSWESEAVPGYWPWMQILRSLHSQFSDEQWQTISGHQSPALSKLLGESFEYDYQKLAGAEEFALHDAVVRLLSAASREKPLLIILDDLHFADPASVRLLQFATQHTWFERLLFVGTYRDVEVESSEHRLRPLLLPLVAKSTLITLTGLDRDEVAELIEFNAGSRPGKQQLEDITRRTGGNPFFVEQTAQLWMTGASALATTPGMSNSLQRRLDQVPTDVIHTLTWAAALGHDFDPAILALSLDTDADTIKQRLHEAIRQRLLTYQQGRYQFVHDLVRETLQARLSPTELKECHRAFFHALSSLESDDLDFVSRVARHAWLAEDAVSPEEAVEALFQAALDARSRLSVDESHEMLRRAVERCSPNMQHRRIILRAALAGSLMHNWNENDQAWRILRECMDAAISLNDSLLMARVALEFPRELGSLDTQIGYKRQAYKELTGNELDPGLSYEEITRQLTIRSAIVARRRGDDEALGESLWTLHIVLMGVGTARQRLPVLDEMIDIGERTRDRELLLFSNSLRWVTLIELNDPGYLPQLQKFVDMAMKTRQHRWLMSAHLDNAMIFGLQGRFAEADEAIEAARLRPNDQRSIGYMMVEFFSWFVEITRMAEAPVDVSTVINEYTIGRENFELVCAFSAAETSNLTRARKHFAAIDPETLTPSARSMYLRLCAQLGIAWGDQQLQQFAWDELRHHVGEWLVSMFGSEISGPVNYWLGELATAQADYAAAIDHFNAAIDQAERLRFTTWAVRSEAGRAKALHAQGDPSAPKQTAQVLQRARHLGMPRLIRQLEQLSSPTSPKPVEVNAFRFDDPTWTLRFEGVEVHLPPTKGLQDLHVLLSQPGQDISATQLLDPAAGDDVEASARLGGDDVLDEEAKSRYRAHLQRLDEQIDTASSLGQDDVAADLDEERSALIDQLRRATGLGGRSRRLGDNAERARKSVTNRIRNTLKRIEKQHPTLAEHLRESVSTGVKCVYQPTEVPKWEL